MRGFLASGERQCCGAWALQISVRGTIRAQFVRRAVQLSLLAGKLAHSGRPERSGFASTAKKLSQGAKVLWVRFGPPGTWRARSMRTVLVTGFGPYLWRFRNASWDVAQGLKPPAGWDLPVERLPTGWVRATRSLRTHCSRYRPEKVLLLGEARCSGPRVERYASHWGPRSWPGVPVAYRVPRRLSANVALVQAMAASDSSVQSHSGAGFYVCNHTFYRALRDDDLSGIDIGLVHVPRTVDDEITGAVQHVLEAFVS